MSAGTGTICRILAALLIAPVLVPAQSSRQQDLAAGKFLVASRDLNDPNFAETVVLLVRYEKEGVVGLILNRRSRIPISRALDEMKGAKGRSDSIYSGGPVGRSGVMALVRSRIKLEDADHVFGDVYLVTRETALGKAMQSEAQADVFHVYLGYAGWTERQLEAEVRLGAWHIFSGDAAVVFAASPQSVWQRLIEKTEERVAGMVRSLRVAALFPLSRCARILQKENSLVPTHPYRVSAFSGNFRSLEPLFRPCTAAHNLRTAVRSSG